MSQAAAQTAGSRFLANLAYLVPSYHGYKERGSRREEDSRLRARVLNGLAETRGQIAELMTSRSECWPTRWLSQMDERIRRLDSLADTIRYAPYGFSGFFDADVVSEESLEWILEADLLLFDDIDRIEECLHRVEASSQSGPGFEQFIWGLDQEIRRMEEHLILRDKALGGV